MIQEPTDNEDLELSGVNPPKLFLASGNTEEAVHTLLNEIKNNSDDNEWITSMNSIHLENITGHSYRGYQIQNDRVVEAYNGEHRPVWYVFYGMGSQWPGMGKQLMSIASFKDSILQCAEILKPLGIDLVDLILNSTENTFDDLVNSYVTIVAIEIALVDLLSLLGVKPDGIIGHSFGEVACAYADGVFTRKESVLAAYWRGKSVVDTKLPENMGMVVTGLSWEEAKKRCPPDVFPSGHNGASMVSVSGPRTTLDKFTAELMAENIDVKPFNTSGVAFHSKYIADAGPMLLKNLENVISNPKPRSSRWISTSVVESEWNAPWAQFNSPAYHVNNFLGPVLFYQGVTHIPSNAIVIEIAPHCLFKRLLKKSLPPTVEILGLHKKDHKNNLEFLITNIGKLHNVGVHLKVSKVYQ